MTSIYEIISVLEHCSNGFCDGCPFQNYSNDMTDCYFRLLDIWQDFRNHMLSHLVEF